MDGELEVFPKLPEDGLGLRLLAPGLPVLVGSDAVLSGVGLHVDSLDSSSSEEARVSPGFLDVLLVVFPVLPPLALAARSCLRNLARRFWNQTYQKQKRCGVEISLEHCRTAGGKTNPMQGFSHRVSSYSPKTCQRVAK